LGSTWNECAGQRRMEKFERGTGARRILSRGTAPRHGATPAGNPGAAQPPAKGGSTSTVAPAGRGALRSRQASPSTRYDEAASTVDRGWRWVAPRGAISWSRVVADTGSSDRPAAAGAAGKNRTVTTGPSGSGRLTAPSASLRALAAIFTRRSLTSAGPVAGTW